MMYACRKKTPSSVWVRGYKHGLGVAFFPSQGSEPAFQRLQSLYPYITPYNNVIETGLSNINTTLHTSLMLLNAACIDNKEDRLFYRECVTAPSLDNLMDALNKERQSLNEIEGMNVPSLVQIIQSWYGHQGAKGDTVSELQHSLPHFAYSKMPTTMDYRYVTEDVPYGLIPTATFLQQLGFRNDVHTALANILCAVCGRNFYQDAYTMEELGIAGMDRAQVMSYLKTGIR
ncbi:NAD/NADP octopine/nopaline dehydrogenase family protein [Flintibacter sp. HCN-6482]|uniref:NAD/NADP octopine/nopaline dehydrogenase family protein n=1 Tax=Flintibacter sp. HCN-6482 TaxID=3134672 RepID=UPI0030C14637